MSLSQAIAAVRAAEGLDLQFEDLTDQFWSWNDRDYVAYHETYAVIQQETGDEYALEVRYKTDEDDNYIRFYVDNGCGEKYDVVFAKANRVEVE